MDRFWPKGYHLSAKIWLVKVWLTTDDLPNSPNFPAAKHSRYTVCALLKIECEENKSILCNHTA